jgi:hypothetical protein
MSLLNKYKYLILGIIVIIFLSLLYLTYYTHSCPERYSSSLKLNNQILSVNDANRELKNFINNSNIYGQNEQLLRDLGKNPELTYTVIDVKNPVGIVEAWTLDKLVAIDKNGTIYTAVPCA